MAEIKHQIPIDATPDKVYAALATQAGLRGWWTADAKADERAGGKAEFGFDKRGMVFRMAIEMLEPSKRVIWRCHGDHPEWDGTTLTWEIAREDGVTMLRFTHSGWKSISEFCATCNSSWGELMYRLKDYVEGRAPGPHWKE
jgi:uncharacterized protein YndB with AHSA1/START domain